MDLLAGLASFLVGILSGFLSVLAGGGVTVVLPVMLELGLTPDQANATVRLNLAVGCLVATVTLLRDRKIQWGPALPFLVATLIGTLLGTAAGVLVPSGTMFLIILATSVVSLVLVYLQPNRWLSKGAAKPLVSPRAGILVYFFLCLYGGIVAVDSATLRLSALVLLMGMPLHIANPIKVVTGLVLFAVSSALYGDAGQIDWTIGAWLSGGTAIGSYIAAKLAASETARALVYRILQISVTVQMLYLIVQWWLGR